MNGAPPGWYPDPFAPHMDRWWDGSAWTVRAQPARRGRQLATGSADPQGERLAGWWWRALALVLDMFITGLVAALVSLRSQLAMQQELDALQIEVEQRINTGQPVDFGEYFSDILAVYADHVVGLVLLPLLVTLTYHAGFLRWKGGTPGKLICGLRVRRRGEPGPLPWSVIAARLAAQFGVPYVAYGMALVTSSAAVIVLTGLAVTVYSLLDVLWAAGERKKALHDLVAGTNVVRTR